MASAPGPGGARTVSAGLLAWRLAWTISHIALGTFICAAVFPWLRFNQRAGVIRWWARGLLRALGVQVRQCGRWPETPGRYLLAANHVSWLDIFVIHSVHPVRFVAKSEVRHWPVAGYLAQRAGTLFVDRERKRDTVNVTAQMQGVLADGDAIGIYPEGTTSDGSVVLPFFSPLLQPAVSCAADVVPTGLRYRCADGSLNTALAYIGDQTFVESFLVTARQADVTVEVMFGTPLSPGGQHRRELTRRVEAAVAALLGLAVDANWKPPETRAAADTPADD